MRFALQRITNPEIEIFSVAEMKAQLREFASTTSRDAEITSLIQSSREWVEEFTARALIDQKWRLTIGDVVPGAIGGDNVSGYRPSYYTGYCAGDWLSRGEILLRRSPVLAITSFVSVDDAGDTTDVEAAVYELREAGTKWPRIFGVSGTTWVSGTWRIEFRAGYADRVNSPAQGAELVPERYKQAMKIWTEAMYERSDAAMMQKLIEIAEDIARPECCSFGMA